MVRSVAPPYFEVCHLWSQISNRASLRTDPIWLGEKEEVLWRSKASKMERDLKSRSFVSPLCLILKEPEPPRRTWKQDRDISQSFIENLLREKQMKPVVASVWIWHTRGVKCAIPLLSEFLFVWERLQVACRYVKMSHRLVVWVTSSHSYLMALLLKASFASCGVFIFTSRVPVITYKCCCHLVQLFTECPYRRGTGQPWPWQHGYYWFVAAVLKRKTRKPFILYLILPILPCAASVIPCLDYRLSCHNDAVNMWSALPSQLGLFMYLFQQSEPLDYKLFLKRGFLFKT